MVSIIFAWEIARSIMSRVYESSGTLRKGVRDVTDKLISAGVIGLVVVALLVTAKKFGVNV